MPHVGVVPLLEHEARRDLAVLHRACHIYHAGGLCGADGRAHASADSAGGAVVQWPLAPGHGGVGRAGAHSRNTTPSIDAFAATWSLASALATADKTSTKELERMPAHAGYVKT